MPDPPVTPPIAPPVAAPVVAQRGPYEVELEAGKTYYWCACGRSASQPFCDGSHAGTGLTPLKFQAGETGIAYLCGCKQTSDKPYCDGTHDTV